MGWIDEIPDSMSQKEGGTTDWRQYSLIKSGAGGISLPAPLQSKKKVTVGYVPSTPPPTSVTYTVGSKSGNLKVGNQDFTIPANGSLIIDYDVGNGGQIFISWGV